MNAEGFRMMKTKYFDTVSTRMWAVKGVERGVRARGEYAVARSLVVLVDALSERGVTIGRSD